MDQRSWKSSWRKKMLAYVIESQRWACSQWACSQVICIIYKTQHLLIQVRGPLKGYIYGISATAWSKVTLLCAARPASPAAAATTLLHELGIACRAHFGPHPAPCASVGCQTSATGAITRPARCDRVSQYSWNIFRNTYIYIFLFVSFFWGGALPSRTSGP